jgi:hypothetical protein
MKIRTHAQNPGASLQDIFARRCFELPPASGNPLQRTNSAGSNNVRDDSATAVLARRRIASSDVQCRSRKLFFFEILQKISNEGISFFVHFIPH